mmetsp:Transcript_92691/g.259063  ORF Transcript_92691/g.259063 Transcript_92691/m.259063 type:complete len:343 (+) Transcript_92691:112-1140(+)
MEAARKRLGNANLTLKTKEKSDLPLRGIKKVTEAQVAKMYKLGGQVMESTNTGMDVLKAVRLSDNLPCVIKTRQRPVSFKSPHVEREWRRTTEVQLSMPPTERLCQFYEVLETEKMYYIVMEKVDGEDLFEVLGKTKPTTEDAREIVRQTLEALHVLHKHGRIHKDLKIENVMVDLPSAESPKGRRLIDERQQLRGLSGGGASPASAKLIDFDTVEDWEPSSPKAKEVLGTDGYIAPEAYLGEYSPASDLYAAGVVMYKVLTGRFPTRDDIFDDMPGENWVGSPSMQRIHERLKQEVVDFTIPPLDKDTAAADLLGRLLKFDAGDRPSAEEALRHEWFFLKD